MTNGRGAGMASFMTKKKKYKFHVEVRLDELVEVPFVSAVLFAKLRLLDGGNFQDHSSREEVKDHNVKWNARFSFPCKMLANASTCVLERCVLRISVRKECKGGRSFTKLGFVDLNLAEYAGAGETCKKALLEGYDTRHRQDNSMLKFSIKMNMLSGDILFKVPSPSLKHKQVVTTAAADDNLSDSRLLEEFSSGSLAGSIASGSSGFGSLPKKRTPLLSSELVINQTLAESSVPVTVAVEIDNVAHQEGMDDLQICEHGHSRNSSNTSQMSKASGYSSIHSHTHSRQSSSGDSGHIREIQRQKWMTTTFNIPSTFPEISTPPTNKYKNQDEIFGTPKSYLSDTTDDSNLYQTPKQYKSQISNISSSSSEYKTPDNTLNTKDVFSENFTIQKSSTISNFYFETVELRVPLNDILQERNNLNINNKILPDRHSDSKIKQSVTEGVSRSKSDFEIPKIIPIVKSESRLQNLLQKSDSVFSFLTPLTKRRNGNNHSTPINNSVNKNGGFLIPNPIPKNHSNFPNHKTSSLNSLRAGIVVGEPVIPSINIQRGMPHRKLFDGTQGGKLAPLATSPPDELPDTVNLILFDTAQNPNFRRPSITTNPSSGSLVISETGSLDRAKAALERRKKTQSNQDTDTGMVGRVEGTRVNPDHLIEELLKNTNLEQTDDSAESSGLQLYIAKDGTASLGNPEVKSQISTGVFKQVVMEDR